MDLYGSQNLAGRKILIVDDEAANINVLCRTLEAERLNISVARDGAKALEIVSHAPPDLILLDVMMPKMDGFETCRQLKAQETTRDIPVIFLTARVGQEDIDQGFSLGCTDYITKPFKVDEVCNRVRTQLLLSESKFGRKITREKDDSDISGLKVLIVDDMPANIDVLRGALDGENLVFSVALNGSIALNIAPNFFPDLILLDVMMPEMDGFEACQHLKGDPKTRDIPIIFVTAKDTSADIDKGFSLGCVDYIPKPFRHNEVRARVRSHLKLRKLLLQKEDWLKKLEEAKSEVEEKVLERTASLEETKEKMEQAYRGKLEFISTMSHEIRTPMNSILGFSQLLTLDPVEPLTDNQKSNVDEILKAGDHLLSLINEILDLGSLESGKVKVRMENLSVADLLQSKVISLLTPVAAGKNISLSNKVADHPNPWVRSDPLRLAQVLINLGSNAIKYNRKGGSVTFDFELGRDGMARITVTDTGPGIPKGKLKSIFEPFVRLESANSAGGTGIGLTICQRFVELMDGGISVESEEGQGTRFTIKLPSVEKS